MLSVSMHVSPRPKTKPILNLSSPAIKTWGQEDSV